MRAFLVSSSIIALTLVLTPFQLAAVVTGSRLAGDIPRLYHRIACRLIGLTVSVVGRPVTDRPVLYVSNHVSWLDIPLIGKLLRVSFVAKREVASWPGFGHLARMQRSVFIDRTRRTATGHHNRELKHRLKSGDNLLLFAEGTSSDGRLVLPFKTALFGVAEMARDEALMIQPVTIRYTGINGMPLARSQRPWLGWYGDMDLVPHFWRVMGLGRIGAEVHFHEPVPASRFESRKALALYCHDCVASVLLKNRRPD